MFCLFQSWRYFLTLILLLTHRIPELRSRGKTVIAVSHDDRYFAECDPKGRRKPNRATKLDYGRVVK